MRVEVPIVYCKKSFDVIRRKSVITLNQDDQKFNRNRENPKKSICAYRNRVFEGNYIRDETGGIDVCLKGCVLK